MRVVQDHLDSRRGKMVVGGTDVRSFSSLLEATVDTDAHAFIVCTRPSVRNKLRKLIQPKVSDELQLVDFPIEPYHAWFNANDGPSEASGSSHLGW